MPGGKLTKKESVLVDRIKSRKQLLKKSSQKGYTSPEGFYAPEKETPEAVKKDVETQE